MYIPDWNLECEIKIRALEALKENLDKEIDELINIAKKDLRICRQSMKRMRKRGLLLN